jgi:hypothetical protein
MNLHPIGEPGETIIDAGDTWAAALRAMSAEQLLRLGAHQVVYLRSGKLDGDQIFVLYGADGTPLVTVGTVESAVEVAAEHGLGFVTVH